MAYRVKIRRRGSGEIQAGPIFKATPQRGDTIIVPYRGEKISAVVTLVTQGTPDQVEAREI